MNMLKYFPNKSECPLCKGSLKKDRYDIYCSCCGLIVFDFDIATLKELDFLFSLVEKNRKKI